MKFRNPRLEEISDLEKSIEQKPLRKAIAIDFDGTLFETKWPDIVGPNWPVITRALEEQGNGAALILWTCRTGDHLDAAIEACEKVGLRFDAINESLPEWKERFGGDARKIGASEYWDDKAVNTHEIQSLAIRGAVWTAEDPKGPVSVTTRKSILGDAERCVCGDRDQQYGSPENSLTVIADLWCAYLKGIGCVFPEGEDLAAKDAAAMMVLFKMARVATGAGKADNWVDAAGYAACGGEIEGGGAK